MAKGTVKEVKNKETKARKNTEDKLENKIKADPKPPPRAPQTKNGAAIACHVTDVDRPPLCALYFAPIEPPPPPPPAIVTEQPPTLDSENPPEGIVLDAEPSSPSQPPRYRILKKLLTEEPLGKPENITAIDFSDNQQTRHTINAFNPNDIISLLL